MVVLLQALHAESLLFYAGEQPRSAAAKAAMRRSSVFLTLLPACMAAAERRRTADTLRAGACRAAEEAWFLTRVSADMALLAGFDAAKARAMAELCRSNVGYDAYLHTGFLALNALKYAVDEAETGGDDNEHGTASFVMPYALLQQSCAFAARALDMRAQRDNQRGVSLCADHWLVHMAQSLLSTQAGAACRRCKRAAGACTTCARGMAAAAAQRHSTRGGACRSLAPPLVETAARQGGDGKERGAPLRGPRYPARPSGVRAARQRPGGVRQARAARLTV